MRPVFMAAFRNELGPFVDEFDGDVKICYFSVKHQLHLVDPFWYGLAWSITDQCTIGFSKPFLFISQKCLNNSVEFAYFRTGEKILTLCKNFSYWSVENSDNSNDDGTLLWNIR